MMSFVDFWRLVSRKSQPAMLGNVDGSGCCAREAKSLQAHMLVAECCGFCSTTELFSNVLAGHKTFVIVFAMQ